jgi:superfamily II DNA or RNA helicase
MHLPVKVDYLAEALPKKTEYVLWTNLSQVQRQKYNEYVRSENSAIADYLSGFSTSPLLAITWLQKLCGHPLLVTEKESVDYSRNFDQFAAEKLVRESSKLQVLSDLVDMLRRKGHRTLIFSQSTLVLDIIECVLKDRMILSRIDGQTKELDRQKRVDDFNEEDSNVEAMLISTKAGGQGLTLTGADTCIMYDPSWNPAEDSQAVDRCYRIGQKKKVTVYRLITAGTVEEKRYERQIHKDGLRRTVFTNTGKNTAKYFTKEELLRKKVFVLGEEGQCEFLDKLKSRGLHLKKRDDPEYIFTSHRCVVGQSSHDIVYSLPEDWDQQEEEDEGNIWHQKKKSVERLGRAQRVLQKYDRCRNPDSNKDKENNAENYETADDVQKPAMDSNNAKSTPQTLQDMLLNAKHLEESGEAARALNLLMDGMEELYEGLSNEDKMMLHDHVSTLAHRIGYL